MEFFTRYYIYVLNESSKGLYFAHQDQKRIATKIFEKREKLKEEQLTVRKYSSLALGLKKELDELADLNGDWTNKMSQKIQLLLEG